MLGLNWLNIKGYLKPKPSQIKCEGILPRIGLEPIRPLWVIPMLNQGPVLLITFDEPLMYLLFFVFDMQFFLHGFWSERQKIFCF